MRVKFGNHIDSCKRVTHSEGSDILLITTSNSLYVVDCITEVYAAELFNQVLTDGYIDVSHLNYSN